MSNNNISYNKLSSYELNQAKDELSQIRNWFFTLIISVVSAATIQPSLSVIIIKTFFYSARTTPSFPFFAILGWLIAIPTTILLLIIALKILFKQWIYVLFGFLFFCLALVLCSKFNIVFIFPFI